MRSAVSRVILAIMILLTSSLPIQVFGAPTPTYTPGVRPGDSWTYGPVACVGLGCAAISANVAAATSTVQSVTGSTVLSSFVVSYDNGTVQAVHFMVDVQTGSGNGTFLLLAGGLVAGNPIVNEPFAPSIDSTVMKTVAGASRSINMIEIENPSTVTEVLLWDQKTGILVEALIGFGVLGSPGFMEHIALKSTNIWRPENSPHFSLNTTDILLTIRAGSTVTTELTATSSKFHFTVLLAAGTSGLSATTSPLNVRPPRDGSATTTLTITAPAGLTLGYHIVFIQGISRHWRDTTFILLNVTAPA